MSQTQGPDPEQPCPWNTLPVELKLRVFEFLVLSTTPLEAYPTRGQIYTTRFKTLSLVSQEFQTLARDVWYKQNTFTVSVIRYHWGGVRDVWPYPHPGRAHLVRRLEITAFIRHPEKWSNSPAAMFSRQYTNWGLLLRVKPDIQADVLEAGRLRALPSRSNDVLTQWQKHFASLDTLTVYVRVRGGQCYCVPGQDVAPMVARLMEALEGTDAVISANKVEVNVKPPAMDPEGCCTRRVGGPLKAAIADKLREREA